MWPAASPSPSPAYLGVEVESHRSGQGCTGGCDISHADLPGQHFTKKGENRNPNSDSILFLRCSRWDMGEVFMGHQGGSQHRGLPSRAGARSPQ